MKYRDLLITLSREGYNEPTSSGADVVNVAKAKRHRCPQCGGEMKYLLAMTAPSNPKYNYRDFLVCQSCSEVVELQGYDW